ncbi:MAG: hypothetical protein EU541_07935 [Promethearchaeota archaeon]|nr:MAG: hypothetical protein EU541_07935 [Candidatus Lokiarchaeota archaeon]
MRVISGLKKLFSKWLYALIVSSFIISWFLAIFGKTFIPFNGYLLFVLVFIAILFGFSLLLFLISFVKSPHELHFGLIILIFFAGLPFILIFEGILPLFYLFCYYINIFLTAFFAFKVCMDFAIKIDAYLWQSEKYNKILRAVEFIFFIILNWIIYRLTLQFFMRVVGFNPLVISIFRIIFWINVIFLATIIIRLLITKKFASYIALFLISVFIYTIYLIFDFYAELIFTNTAGYTYFSFVIDLFLFLYIMGSIFDRVEYLQEKLRILHVETIALFIIIMKLIVQANQLTTNAISYQDEFLILIIFVVFALLVGIYKIYSYHPEKSNKK